MLYDWDIFGNKYNYCKKSHQQTKNQNQTKPNQTKPNQKPTQNTKTTIFMIQNISILVNTQYAQ
jgi:hypothetical protein